MKLVPPLLPVPREPLYNAFASRPAAGNPLAVLRTVCTMKTQVDRLAEATELRRQAEEIAVDKSPSSPEDSVALLPEAAQRMFHELQVHQIELKSASGSRRTRSGKTYRSCLSAP